jgi:sortase (surface protein transpeptidase)
VRTRARHRRRSRRPAVRLVLAVVALAAGATALIASSAAAPGVTTAQRRPATAVVAAASTAASAPVPTSVQVPAVGISSSLVPLGLDSAGALVPPADFGQAGWFAGGTLPGAVGPAVIAGHVDSWRGPAVFFRLRAVAAGDAVLITRADGSVVRFTVTRVDRYPKSTFPTAEVYGPTADAQLRLITCGGSFDPSARSYVDDVVVFARAT